MPKVATSVDRYIETINSKSPDRILEILESARPISEKDESYHFWLENDFHSNICFRFSSIIRTPDNVTFIAEDMVNTFNLKSLGITKTLTDSEKGICLSWELRKNLGIPGAIAHTSMESTQSGFIYKESIPYWVHVSAEGIKETDRLLIVSDIIVNPQRIKALVELVQENNAEIAGIISFVNFSSLSDQDFGIPLDDVFIPVKLKNVDLYKRDNCPLCKVGNKPTIVIDYN